MDSALLAKLGMEDWLQWVIAAASLVVTVIGQPRFDLAARPLLAQHDSAAIIEADEVERVFADIDAYDCNCIAAGLRHGVLLVWVPLVGLSLAG